MRGRKDDGGPVPRPVSTEDSDLVPQSTGCWPVPETLPWALLCTGTCSGHPPAVLVSMTGEAHRDRDIQSPEPCPPPLAPCVLSAEVQYPRLENAPPGGSPDGPGMERQAAQAWRLFSPLRGALARHPKQSQSPPSGARALVILNVIVGAHTYFVN